MDKRQKIIVLSFGILLLIALVVLIVVAVEQSKPVYGEFIPPAFEENAIEGAPKGTLPPDYGKMTVSEDFAFCMCAAPILTGNDLAVYFTSPEDNSVRMLLRLYDKDGALLYESGLLKPGEHLPSVTLSRPLTSGESVYARVLSYEPETYYSMGSAGAELRPIAAN